MSKVLQNQLNFIEQHSANDLREREPWLPPQPSSQNLKEATRGMRDAILPRKLRGKFVPAGQPDREDICACCDEFQDHPPDVAAYPLDEHVLRLLQKLRNPRLPQRVHRFLEYRVDRADASSEDARLSGLVLSRMGLLSASDCESIRTRSRQHHSSGSEGSGPSSQPPPPLEADHKGSSSQLSGCTPLSVPPPLPVATDPNSAWHGVEARLSAGMCLRDCGAGGDCFYLCLSRVLFGTEAHFKVIRRLVAEVLSRPEWHRSATGGEVTQDSKMAIMLSAEVPHLDWKRFVADIRDTSLEADSVVMQIVASIFNVTITVYSAVNVDVVCHPHPGSVSASAVGYSIGVRLGPPGRTGPDPIVIGHAYGHIKLAEPGARGHLTPFDRASHPVPMDKRWALASLLEVQYSLLRCSLHSRPVLLLCLCFVFL